MSMESEVEFDIVRDVISLTSELSAVVEGVATTDDAPNPQTPFPEAGPRTSTFTPTLTLKSIGPGLPFSKASRAPPPPLAFADLGLVVDPDGTSDQPGVSKGVAKQRSDTQDPSPGVAQQAPEEVALVTIG